MRLKDAIAVVTGASRGVGAGIARALGADGATVYVTGRSSAGQATENLPGTIEESAAEVTARGGRGIAVRCDATVDDEVRALFARVRDEHGRLDLLVSNAWGGYELYDGASFALPFWQADPRHWEGMFERGVKAQFLAARHAAPLMIERGRGLIVHTVAWDRDRYLGSLTYDVAKHAIVRMAWGEARELRRHGVAALAVAPGFTRTERVMAAHAAQPFDLAVTESPEYVGRGIAALAADPDVLRRSGGVFRAGDLAREYGFADVDGRQVPPFELPELP